MKKLNQPTMPSVIEYLNKNPMIDSVKKIFNDESTEVLANGSESNQQAENNANFYHNGTDVVISGILTAAFQVVEESNYQRDIVGEWAAKLDED